MPETLVLIPFNVIALKRHVQVREFRCLFANHFQPRVFHGADRALAHMRRVTASLALVACALLCGSATNRAAGDARRQLDIEQYRLTFSEDFDTLDVSARGPGTRWTAHTPWNGDFGDAAFADPAPGFPFTTENGILRIEARKGDDGNWRSGLLSQVDESGNGFTQQYGYFEMRAKLPPGPGLWPAFWLIANADGDTTSEVDIIEHYGVAPDKYESVVHVWPKEGRGRRFEEMVKHTIKPGVLYEDFHTFGATVDSEFITFYLDRQEMGRVETPPEHRRPMFMLLNLAMGSGWPIDQTPNPSYMYVDYVRAYQKK